MCGTECKYTHDASTQTAGVGSGGVTHGTFKQGGVHRASSLQERSVLTLVRIL